MALLVLSLATACTTGPTNPARDIFATPTGTILASSLSDLYLIHLPDLTIELISHESDPIDYSFGPSLGPGGRYLTGVSFNAQIEDQKLKVFDLVNRQAVDSIRISKRDDGYIFATRISPDLSTVAFLTNRFGFPHPPGTPTTVLWTYSLTTRMLRQYSIVGSTGLPLGFYVGPPLRWLPDGQGVVAVVIYIDPAGTNPAQKRLARIDLATGTLHYLTSIDVQSNAEPSWFDLSPDGRTLAYTLGDDLIRFIGIDGSEPPGFPHQIEGRQPNFSPNGSFLTFNRYDPVNKRIELDIYRLLNGRIESYFGGKGDPPGENTGGFFILDWK